MYQSLQEAALEMIEAAKRGRAVAPLLKKLCPHVQRQIVADGRRPPLLSLWGRSLNVDENTGETIVHPAILDAIGKLAKVSMRGRVVHAGLQHTYGYLFSTIDTPYGRKRDRWVRSDMERGFGLDESLLGDHPREGTLLGNLSYFLGRIVFRDEPRRLRVLERLVDYAAADVVGYDYDSLRFRRIIETARVVRTGRDLDIVTTLVRYPNPPKDASAENTLLIYSVRSTGSSSRLVTAFPVRTKAVRDLLGATRRSDAGKIRLRYNAYVSGVGGGLVGRQVVEA